jgi:hypothetical protein
VKAQGVPKACERGQPLDDAHVAAWRASMALPNLNAQAIAAYEREHGPMTAEQRRMVR